MAIMNLTYEKCTIADLDVLVNISRDTFVTAFEKDNNPEDFWNYINKAFNENAMVEQLLNVNSAFYFVYLKNVLVGYLKLNKNQAQTEKFAKRSMELERIYVLKDFQNQGIGKLMLLKAIDIGKQTKATFLWLGVWQENKNAVRFYESHGFKIFGSHPYYLGNDKQTDWLMKKKLR
jgi:ribosomal protein S18 acetylase RimI-like enzyme